MTASQYIDFQNFYKQYDDYMPNLAACFLLPNGKKYGEDYDPIDWGRILKYSSNNRYIFRHNVFFL